MISMISFADEFEKIAEGKKKKPEGLTAAHRAAIGLGGSTIGVPLASMASSLGLKALASNEAKDPTSSALFAKLREDAKDLGVSVADNANVMHSHFSPTDLRVVSNRKNPSAMAHELGHATTHKYLWRHLMPKSGVPYHLAGMRLGHNLSSAMGIPAGYLAAATDDESAKNWITAAPAIAAAPLLAEEAAASGIGLGRMVRRGASLKQLARGAGSLGAAFGTYAAAPLAGVGMAYGTRALEEQSKNP